jgi:hypothetical protein
MSGTNPRVPVSSQHLAVVTTSAKFTNAMVTNQVYRLSTSTDCYYKVAATGGSASAGDGSHYLHAGGTAEIWTTDATNFGFVHVIRRASDGVATLSLLSGGF